MKKKVHHLLAVWDMLGLESIFSVDDAKKELDEYEKKLSLSILKGEKGNPAKPNPIPLQFILLRARMNQHRKYEIYEFQSEHSLQEVKKQFEENPQLIVDWVRQNGHKIYSDASNLHQKIF